MHLNVTIMSGVCGVLLHFVLTWLALLSDIFSDSANALMCTLWFTFSSAFVFRWKGTRAEELEAVCTWSKEPLSWKLNSYDNPWMSLRFSFLLAQSTFAPTVIADNQCHHRSVSILQAKADWNCRPIAVQIIKGVIYQYLLNKSALQGNRSI